MNGRPFLYDASLTEECILENPTSSSTQLNGGACDTLFRLYSKHYGREPEPSRLQRFVQSVHLVHNHNKRNDSSHRITLNQFSDLHVHELPLASTQNNVWNEEYLSSPVNVMHLTINDFIHAVDMHDDRRRLRKHHRRKDKAPTNSSVVWSSLESRVVVDESNDHRVHIKANKKQNSGVDNDNTIQGVFPLDTSDFELHLNWATTENPDGVSIVHRPSDQGFCGSCWAFAATGTLEASASRRVAYDAYENHLDDDDGDDAEAIADVLARQAEKEAMRLANLSVQELVDCDTAADQGCTGGNPLLAYYFIHRYGLAAASDYPYLGQQDRCRVRKVANPIATAQSWGVLTPDHEDNMEMALRWIGPLAVGISGSDPTFLAYKEGIYSKDDCDQVANHALLIVGYGQEEDENGSIVRYWISRNSWGEGWGENGYVKIKRGNGAKLVPGVCGIAKNPSVALGGVLLPKSGIHASVNYDQSTYGDRSQCLEESLLNNYCSALGGQDLQTCHKIEGLLQSYPALTYGVFSVVAVMLFVVWPLTRDCRARSRRREMRRRQMLDNDGNLPIQCGRSESESLLVIADASELGYGTNGREARCF